MSWVELGWEYKFDKKEVHGNNPNPLFDKPWWRHQMETFSALLVICARNSPIPVWINGWVNNREAGDLRRHRVHYDVILMVLRTDTWQECELMQEQCIIGMRRPRARLTKAYDVTIQRYRNSHAKNEDSKMHILRCMGSKFCVKFQRAHKILNPYTAKYAFYEMV